MWLIRIYYLLKLIIPSNPTPRYSRHRNDTYVCVPKDMHTNVHIRALCNSPKLGTTTAPPAAERLNCCESSDGVRFSIESR